MLNMKKRFADGNFVWHQDEVPQNSRYAKRVCYSSQLIAQTVATLSGSCQANQLRSLSLLLGTLSHGAHKPISIVLRTRFLDVPAYGSRHSFPKIFMFSLRYINCLFNLSCLSLGEGAERSEAEGETQAMSLIFYEGELLCQKIQI